MRFTVLCWIILAGFFCQSSAVLSGTLDESVFCGPPARDSNGKIIRSAAVLRAFKKLHPCPSTGLTSGACSGWVMDHVKPLDCGYCDSVDNLQWLPTTMWQAKSLWERKIYGGHGISPGCP